MDVQAETFIATSVALPVNSQSGGVPDAKYPSDSSNQYIYVSDKFEVKEGAKLTEGLFIGKPIGVGLQVGSVLIVWTAVL